MFYVEASGSPYEIGYQTGVATRLAIAASVDMLAKRFRRWDDAQFQRARQRHMAYTEKRCPELVEEVAGIADGAGMPFELIYLTSFYASMRAGQEECSNLIFTETPDGPVLAKTNDLPVHEGKHAGIRLLRPNNGLAVLSTNWPGTVWRGVGINEAGVALGGSSCSAQVPVPEQFMNPHVIGGYVLDRAESVEDAISLMSELDAPAWGANHAICDRTGGAAIVEKAGTFQGVRRPEGSRIWCTNHSASPEMTPYRRNDPEAMAESTARYDAIERLSRDKPLSAELAREIVAYNGRPGALCRYGDDDPRQCETEFACLMFPAQGRIEFCFSHADRDPWYRVSLAEGGEPTRI